MGLEFTKEGHVAKVGLNVPETKNALSTYLLLELYEAWDECRKDDVIRSVVLYSELPDVFCSGMDMDDTLPLMTGQRLPCNDTEKFLFSPEDGFAGYGGALLKNRNLSKPVIAAINGWCLTSGFEMTMGADLRIASSDAKFQMRGTKLGLQAIGGANIYLPAIVGNTRALEILLTGDVYSASKMLSWGFLNKVVPTGDYLMEEAMGLAEQLAASGPRSQQGIIKVNRWMQGLSLEAALQLEFETALPVVRGSDPVEGIKAQRENRKPNFQDQPFLTECEVTNNPESYFNNDYIEICTHCGKIILESQDRFGFPPAKIIFCTECVEQIKRNELSQKNSISRAMPRVTIVRNK